jgi:hypothetical protein
MDDLNADRPLSMCESRQVFVQRARQSSEPDETTQQFALKVYQLAMHNDTLIVQHQAYNDSDRACFRQVVFFLQDRQGEVSVQSESASVKLTRETENWMKTDSCGDEVAMRLS